MVFSVNETYRCVYTTDIIDILRSQRKTVKKKKISRTQFTASSELWLKKPRLTILISPRDSKTTRAIL